MRETRIPAALVTTTAWAWRVIVLGALVYFLAQVVVALKIVFIPLGIGLLLAALLFPIAMRMRKSGLGDMPAAWITLLFALAVLIGTGILIGVRANAEFPQLVAEIEGSAKEFQGWLATGPLALGEAQIQGYLNELAGFLSNQQQEIAATVLSAATGALEVLTGIILTLFILFFFLKDGSKIWTWLLQAFGGAAGRVDRAGRAAWDTLANYIQGTVSVAAVNAVIMAIVLAVMQIPLWLPLAVLIFLSSFVPIAGILVAGGLATLIVLGAKGLFLALVFLGILILEQQVENHLLQPLIVGRKVRFHPLAVILVLAVGGVVAGIVGAMIAVPIAAVLYRATPELFREDEPPPVDAVEDAPGESREDEAPEPEGESEEAGAGAVRSE